MAGDLLASAFEVAEHSKPDVRPAALLRIARVQTALDSGQARRTFEQALNEIQRIPGRDGGFLLDQARLFAAAVALDLQAAIPSERHTPRHFDGEQLGRVMIEHGNSEAALEFVMHYVHASTFPFFLAGMLIERVSEQERFALLRRAVAAWREAHDNRFVWLLKSRSKLLPEEEARDIVREVVPVTLDEPDKPIEATTIRRGRLSHVLPRARAPFVR